MVEMEFRETQMGQQQRQQVSIPFLWEEKPGMPKKGWKLITAPITIHSPPLKLITSVPFMWEEKPGTPLPCFSQQETNSLALPLPPVKLIGFPSPSVKSSSSSASSIQSKLSNMFRRRGSYRDDEVESANIENKEDDEEEEEEDEANSGEEDNSALEVESFKFDKNGPFISSPILLGNCLVSATAISNAVPVDLDEVEEPDSPVSETESDLSSYGTGTTSLSGSSLLESLFPLYSPNSSSLDKEQCHKKCSSVTWQDLEINKSGSSTRVKVRTATLGQLMEMSRRLSRRRKEAIQITKHDFPLEFMKKRLLGCFYIDGAGDGEIGGFNRKHPRKMLQLE